MPRLAALLCVLAFCTACSPPPQKEIDHAQGAIDAAKAAGAERYAPPELTAATAALQLAHDAVDQRDYRLALSKALEASEHAQQAARQAADGQAQARSEVETALTSASASLQQLEAIIKNDGARLPAATLDAARDTISAAEASLQKARTLLGSEQYLEARDALKGLRARISEEIRDVNETARAKAPRRRT